MWINQRVVDSDDVQWWWQLTVDVRTDALLADGRCM